MLTVIREHAAQTTVTSRPWIAAEYILSTIWVSAALITMYPALGRLMSLRRTAFTSYAADLEPAVALHRSSPAQQSSDAFLREVSGVLRAEYLHGVIRTAVHLCLLTHTKVS